MFSKKERLSRADFTEYFKSGRRFQTASLTLVYTSSPTFGVSAVVGKKVSKLAVGRNRIRRRIYATMRRAWAAASPTGVYIIIAKPTAAAATRAELALEVAALLALPHKPR